MIRLKSLLLTMIFGLFISASYGQTEIEQEIFSDLITEEFSPDYYETSKNGDSTKIGQEDKTKNSIIILSETFTKVVEMRIYSLDKFQQDGLARLDFHTMNDFISKNQSSTRISEFHLNQIKITYVSQKEWDEIMEQGGWKLYHNTYGYIPTISLSRPGINESRNKAFIYYSAIGDKLGGAGFYLVLEKVNNKWTVKEKIIAWRS